MNCIAFRRALSISPTSWDAELRAHRQECSSCEAFAQRQAAFESALGDAVRVDVPEGLASRVLLAHSLRREHSRRVRRRLLLLASASVALGVVASWLAIGPGRLDEDVLAHIESEPAHLAERRELSLAQVNEALAPLGVGVAAELGSIRYAGTCWIRLHLGAHLVLEGEKGPVTVLFLPGEPMAGRLSVRHDRLQGVIVPMGRGSVAIVGEPGEALWTIEQRLRRGFRIASRDAPKVSLAPNLGGIHV